MPSSNAANISLKFRLLIGLTGVGLVTFVAYDLRRQGQADTPPRPSPGAVTAAPEPGQASDAEWCVLKGVQDGLPLFMRYRVRLAAVIAPRTHPERFSVTWRYGDERPDGVPVEETLVQVEGFERELTAALEHEQLCALFSVRTFNGAREWRGYTSDSEAAAQAVAEAVAGRDLPLELRSEPDPTWSVYHRVARELGLEPSRD